MKNEAYADTVVVLTINYADSGSGGGLKTPPSAPYGKPQVFGFWGELTGE